MNNRLRNSISDQRGIASILSVVFFILIASIVTVGFTRMALLEGRQSLEDSLSKSALAAAYSGVNDAKRALLYCAQFTSVPSECQNLSSQTCPGFFGNSYLRDNILGLAYDATTASVHVGSVDLNERYTCTIVTEDTYTVEGTLIPNSADDGTTLIPLRGTGDFDTVVVSWQSKTDASTINGLNYGGDPLSASYRDPGSFTAFFAANRNWPALVSAHLMVQSQNAAMVYNNADGSISNLDQRRWWFYPFGGGTNNVPVSNPSRQLTTCSNAGYLPMSGGDKRYMCQVKITGLNTVASLQGTRYLQLTGLYNKADYSVELNMGNTPVRFDNVSPQIDSTGAVENVFRRVQVSLRYEGTGLGGRNPILPNAIDTGAGLCKNFALGGAQAEFSEDCGYN